MGSERIDSHDHRLRRCPMLGHEVAFSYCRAPGSQTPCRKIFDCWWETFDVEAFVRSCYGEEKIAEITAPPKQKVLSLVDLIEQARKEKGKG
jgi:hypothetical protein